MKKENSLALSTWVGLFRNWLSFAGLVVVAGALFSFVLLFLSDTFAATPNPYIVILTYIVTPAFIALGVALALAGAWWERRRRQKAGATLTPGLAIDLSRPHDRKLLFIFMGGAAVFLLLSAFGSYHSYHFTESTQFCGQVCHSVMKPEFVAYQTGSHARVGCTECHVGPGAEGFVRAKLAGTHQLIALATGKFQRPVPTPVANLRPARETCEQCHWPQKFIGNLDRTYHHYLAEETNTPYSVRMLLRVGGADPARGPISGIHWHISASNLVEYLPSDFARQKIPYVRLTDAQGAVTEFRANGFTNTVNPAQLRKMDCIDCHNRPAHNYQPPNNSVDLALALGKIDARLPWIKTNAVYALTQPYTNEAQALENIAAFLTKRYPNQPAIQPAIAALQEIYQKNFFPEMKADWKAYPSNIGHKDWPGCFRCHDDKHKTAKGDRTIRGSECNECHVILAQGNGKELESLSATGQKFKHPGGDYDGLCNDCHSGGL